MVKLILIFGVGVYLGRYWHDVSINEGGVCINGKDLHGKPCGPATRAGTSGGSTIPPDPDAQLPPGDWYKTGERHAEPTSYTA